MVTEGHLDDRMALHGAVEHRSLEERLATCESMLGVHGGRLDVLDAALAAHAEEEVEVEYINVEESPGAWVETAEVEDAPSAEITEDESGRTEDSGVA